jgi:hypothetical protein
MHAMIAYCHPYGIEKRQTWGHKILKELCAKGHEMDGERMRRVNIKMSPEPRPVQ